MSLSTARFRSMRLPPFVSFSKACSWKRASELTSFTHIYTANVSFVKDENSGLTCPRRKQPFFTSLTSLKSATDFATALLSGVRFKTCTCQGLLSSAMRALLVPHLLRPSSPRMNCCTFHHPFCHWHDKPCVSIIWQIKSSDLDWVK